jgi:polar amino acid transport system substrate-binding protein
MSTEDTGVPPEDTKASKTNKILIGALVAIAVIAVGALVAVWLINRGGAETATDPLAGTKWQVRSYYNPAEVGGMASPVGGTQLTAEFTNGQVAGSAGCNSYSASYTVDGDSLSIGQAAATMMYCNEPAGVMDQEAAFLAAMQSASSFKLEATQLHILNDKGQVVVDFVPYTAAPEATQAPAGATPTPAAADNSWDRIQAAGKIVAGTSADYAPFESYVGPGQIDGFDIALMDEIGRRLGVQIEYHDIAFDGLGPSLLQGQIDAAIAAISRTPEREVYADFSNVYLVGEGAALAQQASDITLTTVDDVAKYKVGVQRNSVYKAQIQTQFIDTGQMSPDNLFAYEKAQDAVNDLLAGRIELVVMDSQPAQTFVEQGGVKIVGVGVNQQYYAIALPKGAAALKAKIDEVITALYNDGTISALSGRYLGEPQVLPTPTPGPTSAPAPTPACVDGLTLVKHLTNEGDMKPGQAFTAGWQVQNTGTCPWSTSYRLVFVDGAKMGGEPVAVARQVNAGETYDLQVSLVAPLTPGEYQSVWQMVNAQGTAFGERLKVNIRVVAAPTVTPQPTQTPVPGVQFTVDRTQIKAGECVLFTWSVQNVKEVYFYAEGEAWQDHGVAGQGSSQECPPVTTTYYLRVVYPDNTVDVREITIYVEAAPEAPQITRFTVDPAGQITLGQCVTIRWTVEGKVDRVKLSANGKVLWDPAPTGGNVQDCPAAAGTVAYLLEAVGRGGTSRGQQNINVIEPEPVTPEPPPPPEDPAIYSFSVSPNQIQAGECVGLAWSVGGGATYSRILRNGTVIVDDAGYKGQVMDCLDTAGSYTYQIEAQNPTGQVVTQQQPVNVTEAAPVNPLANTRWQVTAFGFGPVIPGTTLTMAFSPDGSVNGSSGCNTYSATYLVNGSQLSMTRPIGTGMMCGEPAGIMEQEAAFLALLPTVGGFTVEGTSLRLLDGSGQVVAELIAY